MYMRPVVGMRVNRITILRDRRTKEGLLFGTGVETGPVVDRNNNKVGHFGIRSK